MEDLYYVAEKLGEVLVSRGFRLVTAESCTGGGVAYVVTSVPGSSKWFDSGWVTYSNESKSKLLDVPQEIISQHGAVSEPVVRAMAEGALRHSGMDLSIAVTGIAGPTGGTEDKPVGTIWVAWGIAWEKDIKIISKRLSLHGSRESIRHQIVMIVLQEATKLLQN